MGEDVVGSEVQDIPREGGLIRQIQFGNDDFAVFDASGESITANWTTLIGATTFVQVLERTTAKIWDADITVDMSGEFLSGMTAEWLLKNVAKRPESFNANCRFLRLDVSLSMSIAWQSLSPGEMFIVGIGDSTFDILGDNHQNPIADVLLKETASPNIDMDLVSDSLTRLALDFYRRPFQQGV